MPGRARAAKAEVDADDDYDGSESPPAPTRRRGSRSSAGAGGQRSTYLPGNVDELERAYARASNGVDDEGTSFANTGNPQALLPGSGMTEEEFLALPAAEQKKQRRLIRNRLSAHLHRERQRTHISALEAQVVELSALVDVAAVTMKEVQARCTCAAASSIITSALAHACGPTVTGTLGCTSMTAEDVAARRATVARTFAANAALADAAMSANTKAGAKRASKAAPATAGTKRAAAAMAAPASNAARKRPRRTRGAAAVTDDEPALRAEVEEDEVWDQDELAPRNRAAVAAAPPPRLDVGHDEDGDDDHDEEGEEQEDDDVQVAAAGKPAASAAPRVNAPPSPLDHLATVAALAEIAPAPAKRARGGGPVPPMRRVFTMDENASVAVPPSPPLLPVVAPPPTSAGLMYAPSPVVPSPSSTALARPLGAPTSRISGTTIDDFATRYALPPGDVHFLHDMLAKSQGATATAPFDLNALMTAQRGLTAAASGGAGGGFSLNELMRDTGQASSSLVPAASTAYAQQASLAQDLNNLTSAQRSVLDRFVADRQALAVPQQPTLPHLHSFDSVREQQMNTLKLPGLMHMGSFDNGGMLSMHRVGSMEPDMPHVSDQ